MNASDLTIQMQRLDQRLAQVEAVMLRLEQLLLDLQPAPSDQLSQKLVRVSKTVRFVSPHLRNRGQAGDFVMLVTHHSTADDEVVRRARRIRPTS